MTLPTLLCVAVGAHLPYSPLNHVLGAQLPAAFFGFLVGMTIAYLVLVEIGKTIFYRHLSAQRPPSRRIPHKRARHRASRWSVRSLLPRYGARGGAGRGAPTPTPAH